MTNDAIQIVKVQGVLKEYPVQCRNCKALHYMLSNSKTECECGQIIIIETAGREIEVET